MTGRKGEQRRVGQCPLCGKRGIIRLDLTMASHSPLGEGYKDTDRTTCKGTGITAINITRGGKQLFPEPLEEGPSLAIKPVQMVLTFFIARELEAAQKDGLVLFKGPEHLQMLADRLATNLVAESDDRSGRRSYDRLRDALWRALRWKPGKSRRWDDGGPEG